MLKCQILLILNQRKKIERKINRFIRYFDSIEMLSQMNCFLHAFQLNFRHSYQFIVQQCIVEKKIYVRLLLSYHC